MAMLGCQLIGLDESNNLPQVKKLIELHLGKNHGTFPQFMPRIFKIVPIFINQVKAIVSDGVSDKKILRQMAIRKIYCLKKWTSTTDRLCI
jgi:hypothetical protein